MLAIKRFLLYFLIIFEAIAMLYSNRFIKTIERDPRPKLIAAYAFSQYNLKENKNDEIQNYSYFPRSFFGNFNDSLDNTSTKR
jgi:hypothetical protein